MQSIAVKPAITVPLAFRPIINQSYRQSSWHSSAVTVIIHWALSFLSISRIKAAAAERCLKKQDLS